MKTIKKSLNLLFPVLLVAIMLLNTVLSVSAAAVPIFLSTTSGPPGMVVYVSGSGFTASATYNIFISTTTLLTSGTVAADGSIGAYITIPVLPRGSYGISVTTSSDSTSPIPNFTIIPKISLSSSAGSSGDQITVTGSGFTASAPITVYFDNVALTTTSTLNADSNGQLSGASVTIPQAAGGTHKITAGDANGISNEVTFTISPKMTLSANAGAVGASITASGTGFAAGSALSFSIDSTAIASAAITDSNGKFTNITLVIPSIFGGVHTLTVQDASGNSITSNVTVTATLAINPTSGTVNTSVTITGKGYLANSPITLTFDGVVVPNATTLASDASGNVSAAFKVPASAGGNHTVEVSDGTNKMKATFTSSAVVDISSTSGKVGTTVEASGTGFKANSRVNIIYNGVQAGITTADASGSFNKATFVIPAAIAGEHPVEVTDQTNKVTRSFSIIPDARLSAESGFVGSDIKIDGTGFGSIKKLTVNYDTSTISSNVTTDAKGTFSAMIKIPASKGGNHDITVSDGANTKTFKFAMDLVAPAAPKLSIPANLTKADKMPTFSWTDVKDESGVTYTLQISKDALFTKLVLEKQGLTTSTYASTQQETLTSANKKAPYYWRVKAIDGASNESAWTVPSEFTVGIAMGDFLIYLIFGMVAILFGVFGFYIGRFVAKRKYI